MINWKYKFCLYKILLVFSFSLNAAGIELSGESGGYINGNSWNIADLLGKVTTLFYIDPSEETLNPELEARLEAEHFPIEASNSVVIVNTDKSWIPDFVIEKVIKSKQESHPNTLFVVDKSSKLSNVGWLPSPGYVVVVLDPQGKKIYQKEGKFNSGEIDLLITLIRDTIAGNEVNVPKKIN